MTMLFRFLFLALIMTCLVAGIVQAKAQRTVTAGTFIRAETDRMFADIAGHAGGVNRFLIYRTPTPISAQTVVRMNRDTLYMGAVIDTHGGATITMPPMPDHRYASILILDNDHYASAVFYEPGTHQVPSDTRYMFAAVRTQLLNPDDPEEIRRVNALQDEFVITAPSAVPLPPNVWDSASLDRLRVQYQHDAAAYPSWAGMQGPRGKVNEQTRHIAAAAAWGLFPEWDATYLNYNGHHPVDHCYAATYRIPDNDGFWSITVYGDDGFIKSENSVVNAHNVLLNPDHSFTVRFGSDALCGDQPNRVDAPDGWNFLMRIYRPGPSVLDGSYRLPQARPAG
jgi:hypothetical protein